MGFLNYSPFPKARGLLCPGEMCCFQWDPVVPLKGGGDRGGFQQNRSLRDTKFRRVKQWEFCLECPSDKAPGWAGGQVGRAW